MPLLILAWSATPIACAVAYGFVHDRWILQDTRYIYLAMAIGALVWFALAAVPVAWLERGHLPWRTFGALAGASLVAVCNGLVAVNLINSVGHRVESQPAELKVVKSHRFVVTLGVTSRGFEGVTFTCTGTKLASLPSLDGHTRMRYRALIHRGRLGLHWAEF